MRNQTQHEKGERTMRMRVNNRLGRVVIVLLVLTGVFVAPAAGATSEINPNKGFRIWAKEPVVANKIPPRCEPVAYSGQRLDPESYLGRRVDINFNSGLLRTIDVDDYLKPYLTGQMPKWPSGEYLGKFIQGYSRMYLYSGNAAAMNRMNKIVATWLKAQAPDGRVGTCGRWGVWEVWEHKYTLLGLLDCYRLTGDQNALNAARKVGDFMCANLGPDSGDIMQAEIGGLGAGSALEPMTYLYRYTGDKKYLQFCNYILQAFESGAGTKIVSTFTTGSKRSCEIDAGRGARERKDQIRNQSHGYATLSCVIGIVRMYQLTGKVEYLTTAKECWQDISDKRLYITGTSVSDECFKDDHCLPGEVMDGPGEACFTAHWIFLSRILFEITGDPKYVDALEIALYNHMLASQRPRDCHQSYNTAINPTSTWGG